MSKDNQRIKVVHVVKEMSHGGIETFLMSMLRNYDRSRFEMDIIYTGHNEGKYAKEVRETGASLIPCTMGRDQVRFTWRLYKILRERGYDAINSHLSDMSAGALWAARHVGISARVASYHENLYPQNALKTWYRKQLRKIVVDNSTDITTSSPDVSVSHFQVISVPAEKVHPIAYGVDTDFFSVPPFQRLNLEQFGFNSDHLIVGHVGRYVVHKNHSALIKIAEKVIREVPHARFLLCGAKNGPLRNNIEQEIQRLGLNNYFGMVEGFSDIREFYSAIDIFLLPSLLEGMPISLIEAQASKKPVVATALGGIIKSTSPQMQGNLFEINDIKGFVCCITELLSNSDKRIAQGKAGQEFVRNNLDIKNAIRQYEQLYIPTEIHE